MLCRVASVLLVMAALLVGAVGCGGDVVPTSNDVPSSKEAAAAPPRDCFDCQPNDGSEERARQAAAHCADPAQSLENVGSDNVQTLLVRTWVPCGPASGVFNAIAIRFDGDGSWSRLTYNMIGDVANTSGRTGKWTVTSRANAVALLLEMQDEKPVTVEVSFERGGVRMHAIDVDSRAATTFSPMQ